LPLPRGVRYSDDIDLHNNSPDIEAIVINAHRTNKQWLMPRRDFSKYLEKIGDSIIYIDMFLDRWFIAVYCESLVGVWDLESEEPGQLCAKIELSGGLCTSALASLNTNEDAIIVVITG
jgi:hypothetical protein